MTDPDSTRFYQQAHTKCPEPTRECAYDRDKRSIDTKLEAIQKDMGEMKTAQQVSMATIAGHMDVGNQRFKMLEWAVFGMAGVMAVAIIGIAAGKVFGA